MISFSFFQITASGSRSLHVRPGFCKFKAHGVASAAIGIEPFVLMQPWPEEESQLKVTIGPFQLTV